MRKLGKKSQAMHDTVEAFFCFCVVCNCNCYCSIQAAKWKGSQNSKYSLSDSKRAGNSA